MTRPLALSIAVLALVADLALAEPGVEVRYYQGVPQIHLEGSYPQSRYTVYRSSTAGGAWTAVSDFQTLCLGPCYGEDLAAEPGRTYWYRFDLLLQDGSLASYGPYAVTISPLLAQRFGARVMPNPSRGAGQVEIHLAGAATEPPLRASAVLYDLQGRAVRTIFEGSLARGLTRLDWDGRGSDGRTLAAGSYFLRLSTPLGVATSRVLRVN